ncbi:MAG: CoA transferase [Alphaproteobacteria bacterium]|nr:CoA transferase [Alphaproteobacteria bacterium]
MTAPDDQRKTALEGITVLDFTRVLAGPYCTMTLSDLGADIIKVENPKGGDESRSFRPPTFGDESAYFLAVNRNKKSIVLDVGTAEGQGVARDLVAKADVVIENFRTGIMERWGLDYDTLSAADPSLVYCSISGYGRDGPLADRAGYDPVIQAESGIMSVTGEADGDPMRMGVSLTDIIAGLFAGQAILAALYHRQVTGQGQRIDVPLYDTGAAMLVPFASAFVTAGHNFTRFGNSSPFAQPIGLYQAADGPFVLTVGNDALFRKLCTAVLKMPDLPDDPDFLNNELRAGNRPRLTAILNEIFATDTRDNWIEAMRGAGVPAGPIRTVGEAMGSPETEARGIVRQAPHAAAGTVSVIASPMSLSATPVRDPVGSPLLGQHTAEILAKVLGYDDDRVAALEASGTVRRGGDGND